MNIIEYVIQNRNNTFDKMPFTDVDALVYAQLAYYNYSLVEGCITLEEIAERFDPKIFTEARNLFEIDGVLFDAVCKSKRYGKTIVENYINHFDIEYEKQFSATRFWVDEHTCVVSFRGTDGTIVGWKENFNMTYMAVIPSQFEAGIYLNETCELKQAKKVYVVGHSKGGNLAVYASSKLEEKYLNKIVNIYNFDGPGFKEFFYQTEGFIRVREKIKKFIPPQSCVGRILLDDKFEVVKSEDKFLMQHWAYNWVIDNNQFVIEENLESISNDIDVTLDEILEELSISERQYVVDSFYKLFLMHDAMYVDDILQNKQETLKLFKNFLSVDKDKNGQLSNVMWRMLVLFLKNYSIDKKETVSNKFIERKDVVINTIVEKKDVVVDKFSEKKDEVKTKLSDTAVKTKDEIKRIINPLIEAFKEKFKNR